jgi:release factor glutamine methyltransferase
MKLKELKQGFIRGIQDQYSPEECIALFHLVAANLLDMSRSTLMMKQDEEVPANLARQIEAVVKALHSGKPIQYILSETTFYGLKFFVDEHVLIPRFETEELVQLVIETVRSSTSAVTKMLDIGTGSGCIPIAIKKMLPNLQVSALDISSEALGIARKNAELNDVQIELFEANILTYQSEEHYDIITSNPPYIREMEKSDMHQNVLEHEPHLALFVSDERPLIFYEAIAKFSKTNLAPQGMLFLEINEYLGKEMQELLSTEGFRNIQLVKDMQGKDRIVYCQYH